jgi:hypothetical protein
MVLCLSNRTLNIFQRLFATRVNHEGHSTSFLIRKQQQHLKTYQVVVRRRRVKLNIRDDERDLVEHVGCGTGSEG